MLRALWFKQKLVSLSNDNVDVMNGKWKFGSSNLLEGTLITTPGARDFSCAVSGFGQGLWPRAKKFLVAFTHLECMTISRDTTETIKTNPTC